MSEGTKKGMVAGAFSLAMAGLITKVLGVIYIVPFQNMAKDEAMGLYSSAYAFYVVMLQIATAGIPLAISKLISERNAMRDYAGADQLYRVGARYLSVVGLVFFLLMFAGGGLVGWLTGNPDSSTAIRALSFALLLVPVMAAMRGYLQGHQSMAVSGNSQVVEQFVRVVAILLLVYIAVQMDASPGAIAALGTFGGVLGALASLVYLAPKVVQVRRENRKRYRQPSNEASKVVFRRILKVAIPISLSSLVLPLSQLIDSMSVMNLLMWGFDLTKEAAASEFGVLTARAFRLIALPLSLATAIGLSLMPAISEAIAGKNTALRDSRVLTSFRLTSFFAFPTAIGILVLARPIDVAMFQNLEGADTIAAVSFMAIFASYELVTTYILQSIGFMYVPIRNMFTGMGLKLILNLVLVPLYGIMGAAVATVLGYVLSAMLNFYSVRKLGGMRLPFRELYVKPFVASVIMGVVVWIVTWIPFEVVVPWERIASLVVVLVGGVVGAIVFGVLMVLMKGITRDELKRMPVLKKLVR
ncbi:MAG TPA: polysaccharide biosynthesis protein [Bacilli bacterium]|nr:polysaccharide biosynthesis protein [Bacilli bacterium]